tara:strand:+ start:1033 stop:4317 length:3285 start_codon:yes stop_codon:yes gene_type:complete
MANYRTVYQGSARGSRGVGKTKAPSVSQEITGKAQALAGEAAKVEQDYTKVVRQAEAEAKRRDQQATINEAKELNDLKELNNNINQFFQKTVPQVGKDYVAEKRQQGIDLARKAAAGDPEALAKLKLDKSQLEEIEKRIAEQEKNINRALTEVEEGKLRTSLEEKLKAQNIRRLGSNVRFGFIRGTLIEAGKSYTEYLENQLATNEEILPGTDIAINSYHNQRDPKIRKAIIDYVEDQFIANNNPFGANDKAVRTYLTKSVVEQTDKFQALEAERWKRDNAEIHLEDLTNNLHSSFQNFENDPEAAISSIERIFENGRRIMINRGAKGNAGTLVKSHVLEQIPKALAQIDDADVREKLMEKLAATKFNITGQGYKTLSEHWGTDEFNVEDILAQADVVEATKIQKYQTARKELLKNDLHEFKIKLEENEITPNDYRKAVVKLFDTYDDVYDVQAVVKDALNYNASKMSYEQSELYVDAILETSSKITEAEALFIDKQLRAELREKDLIVAQRFGEEFPHEKAKKLKIHENIRLLVGSKYKEATSGTGNFNKNDLLDGDAQKIVNKLNKRTISLAEGYWNAKKIVLKDGSEITITSKTQAMEEAFKVAKAEFITGIDTVGSDYELTPSGFTALSTTQVDTNKSIELHRNTVNKLNEFRNLSENSSSDLLATSDLNWISNDDLELLTTPSGKYVISPTILELTKIDSLHGSGNRDAYHVINLLRAKRGLDPIEWDQNNMPQEVLKFREARDQTTETIQKSIAESVALRDTKATELTLNDMGLVNVGRMQTASFNQDTPYFQFGNNYENLSSLLAQADMKDMTVTEFLNSDTAQAKLNQYITNDLMTKAEKLTNDQNEMIRLTAIGLRYGEEDMANYKDDPAKVKYAHEIHQSYLSGADIETTPNIAAISEEDIVITTIAPFQVDTSGYGTLTTVRPAWQESTVINPEQRAIFEEPIATDLQGARAQLEKINSVEGPARNLRGNKSGTFHSFESQAYKNWEARKERLRNQVQALEILSNYSPSTISTLGGLSGKERMQLFNPEYGLITKILGTQRLNELKNEAYTNSGNAAILSNDYEEALMNLIRSQPEFGNMEMF